jgi:outer membrane lipoprotein-sorting protein
MKNFATGVLAAIAMSCAPLAFAQHSADEMLKPINAYVNFPDSVTVMHMKVIRDDKVEAEYEMKVHKLDSQRMRIEFLQPVREKGRKILRVGDKMWMFLPDLGKPIVISARQSFLGSSFSNGDLLRTDLVADYTAAPVREETLDGAAAQVLELRARSADVAYDRILLWIDKASKRPLRQEFFTLSGKRIKVMSYSKPVKFNGTEVNTMMKVESDLNPREHTVMTISGLAMAQKLAPALFQKDSFDR